MAAEVEIYFLRLNIYIDYHFRRLINICDQLIDVPEQLLCS